MKLKNKITSVLLSLALCVSMLPATTFAADASSGADSSDTQVTNDDGGGNSVRGKR